MIRLNEVKIAFFNPRDEPRVTAWCVIFNDKTLVKMPVHIDCNEVYDSLPCIHTKMTIVNLEVNWFIQGCVWCYDCCNIKMNISK